MRKQVGDLVKVPNGQPALVVKVGACGEPDCDGDLQIDLFGNGRRVGPLCYRHSDVELIAFAAELRVE
jgi:hypothetical protein